MLIIITSLININTTTNGTFCGSLLLMSNTNYLLSLFYRTFYQSTDFTHSAIDNVRNICYINNIFAYSIGTNIYNVYNICLSCFTHNIYYTRICTCVWHKSRLPENSKVGLQIPKTPILNIKFLVFVFHTCIIHIHIFIFSLFKKCILNDLYKFQS